MCEDSVADFLARVVAGATEIEDTLNLAKDMMALVASAVFFYVPLKLWRLYRARLILSNGQISSPTLRDAIEEWKKGADSIIQDATVNDFKIIAVALALSVVSALIGLFLSLTKVAGGM